MSNPLRMPAEWAEQERVFIGFPHVFDEWGEPLAPAQIEIATFASTLADVGKGASVHLICNDAECADLARSLASPNVDIVVEPIGDAWLRDTAAIIVGNGATREARDFGFNWWGGKYSIAGDEDVGKRLAERFGLPVTQCDWILEGGSIDVDGEGLCVTTEQCLLADNRNKGITKAQAEQWLKRDLGIERVLWLGDGLLNDHTDGHVDNLARFVAPNTLALPVAEGDDDPNAAIYADAKARAESFGVKVVPIPSPGLTVRDGEIVPASYMNFYIGNGVVAVPIYGMPNDESAVETIAALFPDRQVIGIRADAILTGGGSLHCISQQVPR